MYDFQKISLNKLLPILSLIIITLAIVLRFNFQFINWSFNGDEVNLGLDILNHNYGNLFKPFQSRQSAPPLFLLLEKLFSEVAKPFISLKIITFLASCISVFLFNRILKLSFGTMTQIVLLSMFCFNPFILSNSLTLKQYSLDLMMSLIAVNYFISNQKFYKTFLFFSVFCLVSNVGLFFSAAFFIFISTNFLWNSSEKELVFEVKLKKMLPYLLAPLPYLLFFLWFINQPGADNMKNYMMNYWTGSFMPLNLSIFKWLALQTKVLYVFFFSTYWFIGIPMLVLFLTSAYLVFQNRQQIFQQRKYGVITLYFITVLVHLFLSVLKMYPFSDRLFLYMAPGIYLILGVGVDYIIKFKRDGWKIKVFRCLYFIIPISAIVLYFTYLPKRSNHVYGIIELINSTDKTVVFTPKAKQRSLQWLAFTKYYDEDYSKLIRTKVEGIHNNTSENILVSVQSVKFGHTLKYSNPEPEITQLIEENKIVLIQRIEGYAIYEFKNN